MTATKVAWSPQPGPQTLLVTCPVADVFYGGARGGGKTDGLLGDFAAHGGEYGVAARGILFRRTYPELEEVIRRSREIYGPMGWKYTANDHTWAAPNGATLRLRFLERDSDADKYQGHQYTWMGFDEAQQWLHSEPIDKLWGSLRSAHGVPCVRRLTGNPPAPSWLKERYIDRAAPLAPFQYQPQPDLRPDIAIEAVFIPAKLEDNPLLMQNDPDYESRLAAVGGSRLYEAWRHGRWDIMVGQVFEEWRADLHVLDDHWVPPRYWRFAAGCDWGYRNPGWFGLFANGPDGDVVCVEELYFRQQTAYDIGYAAGMLCRQYERVEYVAADEQMWYQTGVGAPSLAEEMQRGLVDAFGKDLERAPKLIEATHGRGSRAAKLAVLHQYLRWTATKDGTVQPWQRPRLRFKRRCGAAIRTLPALPYDPHKPEDVDTEAEDHAYDGICAYLMSRPRLPDRPEAAPDPEKHPGFEGRARRRQWERAVRGYLEDRAGPGFRVPRHIVPVDE